MGLTPEQAFTWCEELAENVSAFRKKARMRPESKLEFISDQYSSLFLLVKVLRGTAIMKGFPFRLLEKSQQPTPQ